MPLHDWTTVPAGLYHHFHQSWSIRIVDALNAGRLPAGMSALVEQRSGPREAVVLAIESRFGPAPADRTGAVAVEERPVAQIVRRTTRDIYASRANRIVVRHHLGRVVAVIEIVSPGNKDSRAAVSDFVDKTIQFLRAGVHVLVIDPFPPTPRDVCGLHKAIWDQIEEDPFALPPGKDRLCMSYESGEEYAAYVEPLGAGDALPEMPLFVGPGRHVKTPLELTYQATWDVTPLELRRAVETGVLPEQDADEK
jgi:hypothetical protein